MTSTEADTALALLTSEAVRLHCGELLQAGLDGKLEHFTVDLDRLPVAADLVCETIHEDYPDLDIPPHSRWRHFVVDGRDRWTETAGSLPVDALERARIECELAITSALLDAGAGPRWRYLDRSSGRRIGRSEGLAIASFDTYVSGGFSSVAGEPMRADAAGLTGFTVASLERGFQVSADNPLEGAAGRAHLMQRLGHAVAAQPDVFGRSAPRLGNFADHLNKLTRAGNLPARQILISILNVFGSIWPGRLELAGRNLGDTWPHPAASGPGLVPFHKLSQWLTYSLLEPLQRLGLDVTGTNELTGLAEYRNGGLFVDTGVIKLRDPAAASSAHEPSSRLVIEWRALTVALIDRIQPMVRERLGCTETQLPLASILQGGTWTAGRRIAAALREGGPPPITIISDGSVF
ncbi:MAG: URC4/urg3 family protein [Hyphomicrobiaceae bacterium]